MPVRPIPQDTVIREWITAEQNSARFGRYLTEHPELLSADMHPQERLEALETLRKGFPKRFPWHFVQWREYSIQSKKSLGDMRTCKGLNWLALSNGDRLISSAAATIASQDKRLDPHVHVEAIIASISQGKSLPKMIGFLPASSSRHPVLIEGHARAIAYYLSAHTPYPLRMFVAVSTTDRLLKWDSGLNLHEIRDNFLHHGKEQA